MIIDDDNVVISYDDTAIEPPPPAAAALHAHQGAKPKDCSHSLSPSNKVQESQPPPPSVQPAVVCFALDEGFLQALDRRVAAAAMMPQRAAGKQGVVGEDCTVVGEEVYYGED